MFILIPGFKMAKHMCMLQCGKECYDYDKDSNFNISQARWDNFMQTSEKWKGLDTFGEVFQTVDWNKGPRGQCVHESCRKKLVTERKLDQAKKRKEKAEKKTLEDLMVKPTPSSSADVSEEPPSKRTRSNYSTAVHDKTLCVWCMKPNDGKHPDPNNPFRCIELPPAWQVFKRHTVILSDIDMKDRINCLIDNVYDDPYAAEIRYHQNCWDKYVGKFK